MKIKHLLISSLLILGLIPAAYAELFTCEGMIKSGDKVHVMLDTDALTMNVNGEVHKIISSTKNGRGFATGDFENNDGSKSYYTVAVDQYKKFHLYEFNAKNEEMIQMVNLACH